MLDNIESKKPEVIPGKDFQIPEHLQELNNLKGIGETNDVLKLLCSLGVAAKAILEDNEFTISDTFDLIPPAKLILPAINGFDKIDDELGDKITDEELGILKNTIVESGVLEGDAENAVIEGLELANHLKGYIYKYFVK